MFSKLEYAMIFLASSVWMATAKDFYSFSVIDSDGKLTELEKYRGQVTLVVNVASQCGFTDKHYKGLVNAKKMLQSTGKFEVLAFPCNQFGAQEPKGVADIVKFAQNTYQVNFPIFDKLNVHDTGAADIYKYLAEKTSNAPNWNFWKYLIDHNGEVIGFWGPWSDVEEIFPTLRTAVEAAISAGKMPASRAQPPPPPNDYEMPDRQNVMRPGSGERSGPPSPPPEGAKLPAGTDRAQPPANARDPQPPSSAPNRVNPSGRSPSKPPSPPAPRHDDL